MDLNISLAPEILFYIGSFPVSNTFFWSLVISIFLILVFVLVGQRLKDKPSGLQNIIEMLLEGAYSFVESVTGPGKKASRIFPLVATMFIFILISNLAVFIPGQSAFSIDRGDGPLAVFRAVMSDYGLVLIMTLIAVLTTQIVAIITVGPFRYIGKFFNFKNPLAFFLGIMDLIGEVTKIISLSFRLFGNIFAGEVLGMVMLFLMPFFVPLPFLFLGLLTAFVQAFVFSILTLIFVSMASEIEEAKN